MGWRGEEVKSTTNIYIYIFIQAKQTPKKCFKIIAMKIKRQLGCTNEACRSAVQGDSGVLLEKQESALRILLLAMT